MNGIVWKNGQYFTQRYCRYIEQTLGGRISSVIYSILNKAELRPKQGEAECEARCVELWELTRSFLDVRRRGVC